MVTTMSAKPRNCVLIVEDNPIMADVLKRILLRSGLEGILARNGVEACDLILRQRFAVIVTDFSMPRMNGDEFVRNLRVTTLNCDVPYGAHPHLVVFYIEGLPARYHPIPP